MRPLALALALALIFPACDPKETEVPCAEQIHGQVEGLLEASPSELGALAHLFSNDIVANFQPWMAGVILCERGDKDYCEPDGEGSRQALTSLLACLERR